MNGNKEVLRLLPHRDPFVWVSRIISCKPGVSIAAELDIDPQLPLFRGHFPGRPVFPGVLLMEALAQAACCCLLSEDASVGVGDADADDKGGTAADADVADAGAGSGDESGGGDTGTDGGDEGGADGTGDANAGVDDAAAGGKGGTDGGDEGGAGKIGYLVGIDKAKFRKTVLPGMTIRLEADIVKRTSRLCIAEVRALHEGNVCAQATQKYVMAPDAQAADPACSGSGSDAACSGCGDDPACSGCGDDAACTDERERHHR